MTTTFLQFTALSLAVGSVLVAQEHSVAPEIAKWENAIQKLEETNRTNPPIANGIVYYGSSSIRRWSSIHEDMAPWPAIQRGYGGAKLPDIIHYAPRVLGPHLGETNPSRCRAVVLFVGNDINGNSDPTPNEVAKRFRTLLDWIRQRDATIPILWIEVTPTNSRWDVWPQVEMATKLIKETMTGDPHAHLIATAGAYLGVDGRPRRDLFVDDQLHLNGEGYEQWAILIKANLHAQLGATVPK